MTTPIVICEPCCPPAFNVADGCPCGCHTGRARAGLERAIAARVRMERDAQKATIRMPGLIEQQLNGLLEVQANLERMHASQVAARRASDRALLATVVLAILVVVAIIWGSL